MNFVQEDEVVAGNRSEVSLFNVNYRSAHDSDHVDEEDSRHIPATLLISELLDDEHSAGNIVLCNHQVQVVSEITNYLNRGVDLEKLNPVC